MARHWTPDDIPDQAGRVIVVTGANSGLGLRTTQALASRGARVVMACRNVERGERARGDLAAEVRRLDLADLASVRAFAADLPYDRIDVLVNNAGVMALPHRSSADGFELQFGTNHLGHFALTGLLLRRLLTAEAPRVVTVTSLFHRLGRIDFDDLNTEPVVPATDVSERRYNGWTAYGRSKLANLLFAGELDRRAGGRLTSVAAHPGYAATELQATGPRMSGSRLMEVGAAVGNRLFAQPDRMGAMPQLYAATMPDVCGGEFFGPGGLLGLRGLPDRVRAPRKADTARRLWEVSERLTGVRYEGLD